MVFGGDVVQIAVDEALDAIERGERVPERRQFDFTEEAGRRDRSGTILPGAQQNDRAATALAPEVACMANSPGGGALILGVADDGAVIGTDLDVDWLQVRLYELLDRRLTTVIVPRQVAGRRVLLIRCPHAVEPVRWNGRVTWRVGDQCQEIDPTSWMDRRAQGWQHDWSAQPSGLTAADVRAGAIEVARRFLAESGDERAEDLASAGTADLLRRLALVDADGTLTRAGALLLVGRGEPALDYLRRAVAGGDSQARVNRRGLSLLEELAEVFTTARAHNPEMHVERGLVIAQVRALPERAVREAVVNGVVHRDWTDPSATLVEHIGDTLRVTSPGGFYGGVRTDNIINHPPRSRNTSLAAALATLRVAERQGIGVDRMFGDMLRLGLAQPVIEEQDGRRVLAVLAGDRPDEAWMAWLASMDDRGASEDLRMLMALHRLVGAWWTDADDLAPVLQVTTEEAAQVVARLLALRLGGAPAVRAIDGVPSGRPTVIGLTSGAWTSLVTLSRLRGRDRPAPDRRSTAFGYVRHAGRISSTELASIVHASSSNVGAVLRGLEEEGVVAPSRPNRRGAGFFYRDVSTEDA